MRKFLLLISLVFSLSTTVLADWGYYDAFRSYIGIEKNSAGATTYTVWNSGAGSEGTTVTEINVSDQLKITFYDVKTYKNTGGDVTGGTFYYTIYKDGNRGTPSFTSRSVSWLEELGGGNQKWGFAANSADILNGLTLEGNATYIIEYYSSMNGTTPTATIYDNNGGANYTLKFTTNAALPVELTTFNAKIISRGVELNWKTATEKNNAGFEIQKSTDKNNWNKIGFVAGAGNSNSPRSYSYLDKAVQTGVAYYRLKQIDNDGTSEYSAITEASVENPGKFSLGQNYPNPFNPATQVSYSLAKASNVKITMYNALGQEVRVLENSAKEAGYYTLSINASDLGSGVYYYKLEAGSFTQLKKMIVLK